VLLHCQIKFGKAFRDKAKEKLDALYEFHILRPQKQGWENSIITHFHELNGKIYRPSENCDYIILALLRNDKSSQQLLSGFSVDFEKEAKQSLSVKEDLTEYFHLTTLKSIKDLENSKFSPIAVDNTPLGAENLSDDTVIIAYCNDNDHLEWILNKHMYNMRADYEATSMILDQNVLNAKYLLLHNGDTITHLLTIASKGPRVCLRQQLIKEGYPTYKIYSNDQVTVDIDKENEESNTIYLVYSLNKTNSSEDLLQQYSWQLNKIINGRPIRDTFILQYDELLSYAIKNS